MLAAPAVDGASGGASCAVRCGLTGALAPSESRPGQVSTSLPLAPRRKSNCPAVRPGSFCVAGAAALLGGLAHAFEVCVAVRVVRRIELVTELAHVGFAPVVTVAHCEGDSGAGAGDDV